MSESKYTTLNTHIPELDGLRGIAILSVLFYHLFWFTSDNGGQWSGLPLVIYHAAQMGWIGVNLFFVLSGFLITRILINQKNEPHYFSRFYTKRTLRILPLHLITLVFIFFYFPDSTKFVLLSLLFLGHASDLFGVTACYPGLWSLSIEEQFYLFWPWVVRKLSTKKLQLICLSICVIEPVIRAIIYFNHQVTVLNLLSGFDGFAYGAGLSILFCKFHANKKILKQFSYLTLGLACLIIIIFAKHGIFTRKELVGEMLLPSIIYLLATALMAICLAYSGHKRLFLFSKGILPSWGKVSYAAYLCHYMVPKALERLFLLLPSTLFNPISFSFCFIRALVYISATYFLSLLIYQFIERPFLRLKTLLTQDKKPALTSAEALFT